MTGGKAADNDLQRTYSVQFMTLSRNLGSVTGPVSGSHQSNVATFSCRGQQACQDSQASPLFKSVTRPRQGSRSRISVYFSLVDRQSRRPVHGQEKGHIHWSPVWQLRCLFLLGQLTSPTTMCTLTHSVIRRTYSPNAVPSDVAQNGSFFD